MRGRVLRAPGEQQVLGEVERVPAVAAAHGTGPGVREEGGPELPAQDPRQLRRDLGDHTGPLGGECPALHPDPPAVEPLGHGRPGDERREQRGLREPEPLPRAFDGTGAGTGAGGGARTRAGTGGCPGPLPRALVPAPAPATHGCDRLRHREGRVRDGGHRPAGDAGTGADEQRPTGRLPRRRATPDGRPGRCSGHRCPGHRCPGHRRPGHRRARQRRPDHGQFLRQLLRRREVVVPLQEDPGRRDPGRQVGEDVEDRTGHRMGVRVVPDAVPLDAARHVHVRDGLDGQLGQGAGRVLAAVDAVGVQVGDVDEEPYPGALHQLREELPLRHLLARPGDQGGDVLQGERHGQRVLRDAHVLAEHVEGVAGAGHGEQVARLQRRGRRERPPGPYERDVLRDQRRSQRHRLLAERREPRGVGPVRAAEPQRHAVRHDRDAAPPQPGQGVGQVVRADVLRDDLHPVHPGQPLHRLRDLGTPADADAEFRHVPLLRSSVPQ